MTNAQGGGLSVIDFRGDFDFMYIAGPVVTSPEVTDFADQTYSVLGPANLKIETIPEPASMVLFAVGGLALLRRSRKV